MKQAAKRAHTGVRIIAGRWRGRRLKLPSGTTARPTPDRVRETLFNWLGYRVEGAVCLDLFAGSGVLGLEALSRGAAAVRFVEADRRLTEALLLALRDLGATAEVYAERAERFLERPGAAPADIVFLDPPYELELKPWLDRLRPHVGAQSLIYIERSAGTGLPAGPDLEWHKLSRAGAVHFGLARLAGLA